MSVQMIAQHETWISIDPVQGCPVNCAYCYLGPVGLTKNVPRVIEDAPAIIYQNLLDFPFFEKSLFGDVLDAVKIPVCIGNYTDMCMTPKNREFLYALLQEHKRRIPDVPVCIVTKANLSVAFLERLDQLGLQIILFISLSFLPPEFEKGAPHSDVRLQNFSRIAELKHVQAIHFWRPVIEINAPDRATIEHQIDLLQSAGSRASVITGLKFGDNLARLLSDDLANPLNSYFIEHQAQNNVRNEIFDEGIKQSILELSQARNYPVFLHTSCAISYMLNQPDYNATFRKLHFETKCLPSSCPAVQRERCFAAKNRTSTVSPALLAQIAERMQITPIQVNYLEDNDIIAINRVMTQEEQTFLTQSTSFPVRGEKIVPTIEWLGSINR